MHFWRSHITAHAVLGTAIMVVFVPAFVAVSSGIAVQAIMNVPLTTGLLSNGIALLFLLWWLTPEQRVELSVRPEQAAQPINAVGLAA